jgi:nitrogen fixation protein NifU and related proteins
VDFEELYQDVILDHSRRPRNYGELPSADFHIHGDNPNCGDEIMLHIKFAPDDTIAAASFTGNGCSICMASASMMTQKIKKRTRAESAELMRRFHEMLTSEKEIEPDKRLGDLGLLRGVRKFPLRVKCATLPWHALEQALAKPAAKEVRFSEDGVGGK